MKMCKFILRIWVFGVMLLNLQASYAQGIIVPPYLQPGNSPTLKREQKVLIWQTDSIPGDFKVEWAQGAAVDAAKKPKSAKVSAVKLRLNNQTTYLYRATIGRLKFDQNYAYRVVLNGRILSENVFHSRTKTDKTRFAVFGDSGGGTAEEAALAFQIHLQKPAFALVLGDMAYSYGREIEYRVRFFPYYLTPVAAPERGAPLMNTIPFYMLLGNHDIYSADFEEHPDGLAFFYYSDLPRNGPIPESVVKPVGNEELIAAFLKNTSPRYPGISNYSFDYGNVHIVCLDANYYVNPLDPVLLEWLANDLKKSKADWKIVAYHHPAYNASLQHYEYQIMRLLSPVLEELGVDLVFNGHTHNYQRTMPLKFAPKVDEAGSRYMVSEEGSVDGEFTLDDQFDGIENTTADGIIYVVSGAGGAALYDPEISEKPELWKKGPPENWAPFTVKLVSDRHSFTLVETEGKVLRLKQMDAEGKVFDEIKITK